VEAERISRQPANRCATVAALTQTQKEVAGAATLLIGGVGRCGHRHRGGLFVLRRNKVSVDKDELAKEMSAQLTKQSGRAPESVECPDDLAGEVGATTHCTLNDAGTTYGVDVNVTKVEGTDVEFDLEFDNKPQ
jgi:Domain of unknown function (DUF4333)